MIAFAPSGALLRRRSIALSRRPIAMNTTTASPAIAADLDAARAALAGQIAVCAELADRAVLRASGEEAGEFLNKLLTNDIQTLPAGEVRLAGLCTPKGRLLGLFSLVRDPQQTADYLIILPAELSAAMLKKLSMYILRSKLKLSDATADFSLYGVVGSEQTPPGGLNAHWNRTGPELRLVLAPAAASAPAATLIGLDAWRWLEIAAGIPSVVGATQEAFVPQMLNLELAALDGVSFRKGCYPGQEIVARTHYLGKVKRRMLRARCQAGANLSLGPGTPLYAADSTDQACGALVAVAPEDGAYAVLACLQLTALEAGPVHVGSPQGPALDFLPLPYDLDGPDTRSL